jgi:hypothetical protein
MRPTVALLAACIACCSLLGCNSSDPAGPTAYGPSSSTVSPTQASKALWSRVANEACARMQQRISALGGFDYWAAINTPLARKRLPRIACLYGQWLRIKEEGLREIQSQVLEPTAGQADALASYEEMLNKMGAAVRMAERGNRRAYVRAYLQMLHAIDVTREAFAREGAANICNFPI